MFLAAEATAGEGQRLLGTLTDNHVLSGAAADAALASLGNDRLHEYCFAAGTPVVTRRGLVVALKLDRLDRMCRLPRADVD